MRGLSLGMGLNSVSPIAILSDGIGSGEKYFAADGGTYPWYVATRFNAFYDATDNKTWVCYIGWDGSRRVIYVRVFNHANNTWSPKYMAGISIEANDDHGAPAMMQLPDGRVLLYYGAHNQLVFSSYTTNPRDPTNWTIRPSFGASATYWHPVYAGGKVTVIQRKLGSGKYTGVMYNSTAISNGAVTFGSELTFGDFGADSRYYLGAARERGGKIHFLSTRANFSDDYRVDVFYLVYDPATGIISNIDGSYSVPQSTWSVTPISKTDHETYFRIYAHDISAGSTNNWYCGNIPDFDFDADGNPHVVIFNGKTYGAGFYGGGFAPIDILHIKWTGSAWTSPVVVDNCSQKYDGASIVHKGSNVMQIMYTSDAPPPPNGSGNNYRGGDMYVRDRDASGNWGTAKLIISQDTPWAWDVPNAVLNGHPNLRWVFAEKSVSINFDGASELLDTKAGFQRMIAYGDSGFVKCPETKLINLSCTQISAGRAVNDTIGIVSSDNPANTYSIVSDPDNKFILTGNFLKLKNTVTAGNSHSVTIRSATIGSGVQRGIAFEQTFTLSVIAADSLLDKLILEYKLDEGSGQTLTDNLPRKFNGCLGESPETITSNEPTWSSIGLNFSTTGGKKTRTPYNPALMTTNFHAFIVYRNTASPFGRLLNYDDGWFTSRRAWYIQAQANKILVGANISGGSFSNVTTAADVAALNTWTLLEVIVNGTSVTIRANGAVGETLTLANAIPARTDGALQIGDIYPASGGYSGQVAYLAMSGQEITGSDLSAMKSRIVAAAAAKGITLTVA